MNHIEGMNSQCISVWLMNMFEVLGYGESWTRLAANSLKTDDPKMTLIDTTVNFNGEQ